MLVNMLLYSATLCAWLIGQAWPIHFNFAVQNYGKKMIYTNKREIF